MRLSKLTLLVLAVTALVPSAAIAKHGHPNTFERTFPAESRLCAAVAAGHVPVPLQGSEAAVTDACTALHAAYDAAAAAAMGTAPTTDGGNSAVTDALAQVQTACGGDTVDPEACDQALQQVHQALRDARHGRKSTKRAYRRAIETARRAFRQSLHGLKVDRPHGHGHGGQDQPQGGDQPQGDDQPSGDDAPQGDDSPSGDDAPQSDTPDDGPADAPTSD
jgi:hypothetical protein